MKLRIALLTSLAVALATINMDAAPIGTAFSYQGKLVDGADAATGLYDFQFRLMADPEDGLPLTINVLESLPVTNGIFTAELDFGGNRFNGDARWLEIAVRVSGSGSNFTTLLPRTPVHATPYATFSANAAVANSAKSVAWTNLTGIPAPLADGIDDVIAYNAGPGLVLGPNNTFGANFGGSGSSTAVSRTDHHHFGQSWVGSGTNSGLDVRNTLSYGSGLVGRQGSGAATINPVAGVFGHATDGDGVVGSSGFRGVFGLATHTNAENYGVYGYSPSKYGYGVYGSSPGAGVFGNSDDAAGYGVYGRSKGAGVYGVSENLYGVFGKTTNATAVNFGVFGSSPSKVGYGVYGNASATNGVNFGIAGVSASTLGRGVQGWATADTGTNFGGWFLSEGGSGVGVYARALGAGAGVQAMSHWGNAGSFEVTNRISGASTVKALNAGDGHAGEFLINNPAADKSSVRVWNNGSGDGVNAMTVGDGDAGYFFAVGEGNGVYAHSSGGVGLKASSSADHAIEVSHSHASAGIDAQHLGAGSAIRAKSFNGAALEIAGGAIKVTGAGVNTHTAAFIHQINSSNTDLDDAPNTAEYKTRIDNKLCNGREDAILMVIPRRGTDELTSTPTLSVSFQSGYWYIENDSLDEWGDFDDGERFNVMVILP